MDKKYTASSVLCVIDIVLDAKSLGLFRNNNLSKANKLSSDLQSILGSCSAKVDITCEKVFEDLLLVNLYNENITLEDYNRYSGSGDKKCDILNKLTTKTIDYHLVYVFDKSPGSVDSFDNNVTGEFKFVPIKPKLGGSGSGGRIPATQTGLTYDATASDNCDPCAALYKGETLSYNFAASGRTNIQNGLDALTNNRSASITYDWTKDPHDFDTDTITGRPITRLRDYNYIEIPDYVDKAKQILSTSVYFIKKRGNVYRPTAKYDGFNTWLYAKYYGGQEFDYIYEFDADAITDRKNPFKTRVGIIIGPKFTVTPKIVVDISEDGDPNYFIKLFSITNSMDTELFKIEADDGDTTITSFQTDSVTCCSDFDNKKLDLRFCVKNSHNQIKNIRLPIDRLQRAQGGIYKEGIKFSPCCENCGCTFDLCGDLNAEFFRALRDQELKFREYMRDPYVITNASYEEVLQKAKTPGPQCVLYDLWSGWPVPLIDTNQKK